jgi:hypothetical protein
VNESPVRYRCMICDEPWDYEFVRHVGCCPSCGGALLCVGADATPAATTVAAPEPARTG